jgi:hypothetical protein
MERPKEEQMTKEELQKIKDKTVGKRVLEIIQNGFKALFEKEFGANNQFISFHSTLYYDDPGYTNPFSMFNCYNNSFMPPNNLGIVIVYLTKWASGELQLGFDFKENIKTLKTIQAFEKYSGTDRIIEFEFLCKDKNYNYEIYYDTHQLGFEISKKIKEIGNSVLKLQRINADSRKLDIFVNFDCDKERNINYCIFRVFFREEEDFLECLKQLTDNCKKKNLNTYKEIRQEIEGLPLQEYRVTK